MVRVNEWVSCGSSPVNLCMDSANRNPSFLGLCALPGGHVLTTEAAVGMEGSVPCFPPALTWPAWNEVCCACDAPGAPRGAAS